MIHNGVRHHLRCNHRLPRQGSHRIRVHDRRGGRSGNLGQRLRREHDAPRLRLRQGNARAFFLWLDLARAGQAGEGRDAEQKRPCSANGHAHAILAAGLPGDNRIGISLGEGERLGLKLDSRVRLLTCL